MTTAGTAVGTSIVITRMTTTDESLRCGLVIKVA
ncbi:hypothetical protein SAMN06266956_3073 [Paraburkholderia hospita]|nr:hypothetical protein SAMN06266956_3073 [Paraburkholderia hospita]